MTNENDSPAKRPQLRPEKMDKKTIEDIYRADQLIYPSNMSLDRLNSWMRAGASHFSHRFLIQADDMPPQSDSSLATRPDDVLAGTIIAIPLRRQHWEELLCGKLLEPDIDEQHLVESAFSKVEVGVHIFHVEKEELWPERGFTTQALACLRNTAHVDDWNVIGFSALAVTAAGNRAFEKIGFEPSGFLERFLRPRDGTDEDGRRHHVNVSPDAQPPALPDDMVLVWQAEMLKLDTRGGVFDCSILQPVPTDSA